MLVSEGYLVLHIIKVGIEKTDLLYHYTDIPVNNHLKHRVASIFDKIKRLKINIFWDYVGKITPSFAILIKKIYAEFIHKSCRWFQHC